MFQYPSIDTRKDFTPPYTYNFHTFKFQLSICVRRKNSKAMNRCDHEQRCSISVCTETIHYRQCSKLKHPCLLNERRGERTRRPNEVTPENVECAGGDNSRLSNDKNKQQIFLLLLDLALATSSYIPFPSYPSYVLLVANTFCWLCVLFFILFKW